MRENLKYWLFANNGFWITVSIVIDILRSVMLFIVCSIKSKFILTEYCLNMSFIHKKKTYLENTMLQLKEKSPKVTLYKGLSNTSTFARLLSFEVKEQPLQLLENPAALETLTIYCRNEFHLTLLLIKLCIKLLKSHFKE